MMFPIRLGVDLRNDRAPVELDPDCLSRHLHCIGATGSGKTVAIHALIRPLLKEPRNKACLFLIDPMGNLSQDLLHWIASPYCPEHVRQRLVYIEPARSDYVTPFNPLRHVSGDNAYYHVARAVDLILRAWKAQDLGMQPRLMQWSYKAMAAMAALDLPIAMSEYLLHPGTDEHKAILDQIPDRIRHQWLEILNARGSEPTRILESTRNRFEPIYNAVQTKRMFGSTESRFDVERFIRERRIVVVNVAKLGKIPQLLGSTIGSLITNEVLETTFNMAAIHGRKAIEPVYLLLDECQMFVSPDLEDALPTCRQMGLRLLLANQSFGQLQQGDIDLSNIIWQARNRLAFANSAEDADIIAEELATLTFDPMAVKDRRTSLKQLISGYRIEWLESEGVTDSQSGSTADQRSVGYARGEGRANRLFDTNPTISTRTGRTDTHTSGGTKTEGRAVSRSRSQHLVPIHETIEELSNVTYRSFDEHRQEWRKVIRDLATGIAFARFVDDPHLYQIDVDYRPVRETRRQSERYDELIARNFEQDIFISAAEADRLAEEERRKLLTPKRIVLQVDKSNQKRDPFR